MIPVQESSERLPQVSVRPYLGKLKPFLSLVNAKLPLPVHQMRPTTINLYFTGAEKSDNNEMKLMNE